MFGFHAKETSMSVQSRFLALTAGLLVAAGVHAQDIKIGLVAALTGQSAQSGEAITRGLTLAIDELNAKGGILGKKVVLVRRDDESSPPKGLAAARELISNEKVAALFGGIDSPVSLAIVPVANKEKVPFMGVWAAATNITKNGANPNYVFRVSAQDDLVDVKLVKYAMTTYGVKKPGLVLINNPWGESNEKGLKAAAEAAKIGIAGIEKVEATDVDMTAQLTRLKNAGADALILVANAAPGAQMMKARERMGWKVPVISHWGISGGRFDELVGPTAGDAHFVQTYSFAGALNDTGKRVYSAMQAKYGVKTPSDVLAPVGTANAYDAMNLLARAIEKAKSTDGEAIRKAMYEIDDYAGLIKTYKKPFGPNDHEGLAPDDYIMVKFEGAKIVPVK
jgi:branched-chain amino acid transport system substrate-binding protein